jgi:pilus assembly protein CpaB
MVDGSTFPVHQPSTINHQPPTAGRKKVTQLTRRNVLLLAVAMAAATTFVAYLFLTRSQVQALSKGPATQTMVVVARKEIKPLQLLRPEQFAVKQVKADGVARDAVTSPEDLKGKVALVTMPAGQVVTERQVQSRGPELGLAYSVKPPLRAVTVALDPIIGVAGFPKPGNRVDVLATFTTDYGMVTRTVLQDIEILALNSDVQPSEVDPHTGKQAKARENVTATLAVLPGEAEKLVLAENRGKLRLALRAVDDKSYAARTMTKELNVVGIAPVPKNQALQTVVTKPAPAPESRTYREDRSYREEVRQIPPPVLPQVSYTAPAPKPTPEHVITVVKGSEKHIVRFKKNTAPKASDLDIPSDAGESN